MCMHLRGSSDSAQNGEQYDEFFVHNNLIRLQRYKIYTIYTKKYENICIIQKKAVPLQPILNFATVAQLVEQRIRNAWVGGSSPPSGSKKEGIKPSFFVSALPPRGVYGFLRRFGRLRIST